MSKREKIILVLTAVAVLYGAYSFLFEQGGKRRSGAKSTLKDLNQFVLSMAESLPKKESLDTETYVVKTAQDPWSSSPFIKIEEKKSKDETKEVLLTKPEVTIIYSGFIQLGGKKLAIINGFEYEEGESLEAAGYYLEKIFPKEVIVGIAGGRQKYRIQIEDTY